MERKPAALVVDLQHGLLQSFENTDHPSTVYGFRNGSVQVDGPGTLYGFMLKGYATVMAIDDVVPGKSRVVKEGEYFSVPFARAAQVKTAGEGYFAVRHEYKGLPCIGGPVEDCGRLKYIDGCSDTLLIGPPVLGDPCMNLLHFPAGIKQTLHTHPTIRAGLIFSGRGLCHTEAGPQPLSPGRMFILFPDAVHGFETMDDHMTLVVYHPDTDTGPSHDDHPMLNRTMVEGESARHIDAIRTQQIAS